MHLRTSVQEICLSPDTCLLLKPRFSITMQSIAIKLMNENSYCGICGVANFP